jgi:hypothetical protein
MAAFNSCKKDITAPEPVIPGTTVDKNDVRIIQGRVMITMDAYKRLVEKGTVQDMNKIREEAKNSIVFKPFTEIKKTAGAQPGFLRDSLDAEIDQDDIDDLTADLTDPSNPLGATLNSDAVIQIDSMLYKIDFWNDKVFTLKANLDGTVNDVDYNDLVNGNRSNPKIGEFDTDDEVLQFVAEGYTSKDQYDPNGGGSNVGIFCFNKGAPRLKDEEDIYYEGNNKKRLKCKIVYEKAGIWFSLQSKVKAQKKSWIFWVRDGDANVAIYWFYIYTIRCPLTEYGPQEGYIEGGGEADYRAYRGWKGLRKYVYQSLYYKLNSFPTPPYQSRVFEIKYGY